MASAISSSIDLRRHRRMHQHDQRAGRDQADRREILARVVADIGIERRIDRERAGAAEHERVAVGRGLRDRARRDRAAGAAAVLDHDLLAERLAHLLGDDARHHVVAAAGRVGHDQRDRPVGIVLRRGRRCGREGRPRPAGSGIIGASACVALLHPLRPVLAGAGYCRPFRVIDKCLICEDRGSGLDTCDPDRSRIKVGLADNFPDSWPQRCRGRLCRLCGPPPRELL